jgi:cytochrome P450
MAPPTSSLFTPQTLADPYPAYRQLRDADPVHWHEPFGAWILTRYDDVLAALHDPRLRSDRSGRMRELSGRPEAAPVFDLIGNQMNLNDPPRHTRLRAALSKAFTPHAVEALRPFVEGIVNRLLDAVQHQGRMDVIADFAFPLPATVIAQMLGLPPGDLGRLRRWSDDFATVFGSDPSAVTAEQYARARQSTQGLTDYFRGLAADRKACPRDDLLTALVAAEDDGLTEGEFVANANLLMGAGHETTTHLIGNGLLALLRHPDQLERLRADPSLIPGAVEEFLRYDGPVQFMYRVAGEDLAIGGKPVRRGQLVYVMFGAANHDPAKFPDPDRLDIGRAAEHHLAFGQGLHYCLGAPLARLEAQAAFAALLRRLPALRLDGEALQYQENFELRGLKRLPVAFG